MIKQFPTLYCRDNLGNVREWHMEQEDNRFRAVSGIQSGQFVTSEWSDVDGKNIGRSNETSPIEQATKEIESKYKKQIEQNGYRENIKDIDTSNFFSPQLAHKYDDYQDEIDWGSKVYVSPKLDGLRCIITKDGAFSRNGKRFVAFPHIWREMRPLFERDRDLIFDGEIYSHEFKHNFDKIISLAKKTKPTKDDLEESEKYIQIWLFDYPSCGGGYHDRYTALKELVLKHFYDSRWIRVCIHKLVTSHNEVEEKLASYLKDGFEGLMLNQDHPYQQKRTKAVLKYKKFLDEEFKIVGITEGVGNRSGMFGYATLAKDGKTFDANARGNEELYAKILKNKQKYIGKMATVRYQNLTPDGIPRFPVIIDFDRFD